MGLRPAIQAGRQPATTEYRASNVPLQRIVIGVQLAFAAAPRRPHADANALSGALDGPHATGESVKAPRLLSMFVGLSEMRSSLGLLAVVVQLEVSAEVRAT